MAHVQPNEGIMSQDFAVEIAAWPSRMRRREASQYLQDQHGIRLAHSTLAKLAVVGGGPPFRLDGRFPVYDRADLDVYADARLGPLRRSTSDRETC
jgi:hypothetical protein